MRLVALHPDEYSELFKLTLTPYGSVDFNRLNAHKVDSVEYLALQDDKGKYRLGAIFGLTSDSASCPFSAPFGEITAIGHQKIETVATFIGLIKQHYATRRLRLTLPPDAYGDPISLKASAAPALAGHCACEDINYHFDIKANQHNLLYDIDKFVAGIDAHARNHYNQACRAGFEFEPCDIARAYDIISLNRAQRGFPLRMSYEQLQQTSRLVDIDSFALSLDGRDTASAIVYRLNDTVAQLIYWGHLNEFARYRPMNFLAYKLLSHYARQYSILDLGPSSSDGIADLGLCSFKESLGAQISFKRTFLCDAKK